jgi:hypothetical protein
MVRLIFCEGTLVLFGPRIPVSICIHTTSYEIRGMQIDPHEPGVRHARYAKCASAENFFEAVNRHLADAVLPRSSTLGTGFPLIYIVGAPRSGTTLLHQLLSRHLPVGYINNLIARFWLRPSVGIWLTKTLLGEDARHKITFHSWFGTTQKIHEPHEFGYFWRHWLKLDQARTHKLSPSRLKLINRDGLKEALESEILGSFNLPVVFKNVICGLQADFLTEIHPLSLFIHIKRDPFITAASILKSRHKRFGSYDTWWSLKPSTWPFSQNNNDASSEAAMQVYECRREIDEELSKPRVHALKLTYEELCDQPAHSLERICNALERFGKKIKPLTQQIPPLRQSRKISLPRTMQDRLNIVIEKLFSGECL